MTKKQKIPTHRCVNSSTVRCKSNRRCLNQSSNNSIQV